jgi:starch phosphorylase
MIVKDPLCGMPVDPEKTEFKAETLGKIYYFCSEQCMRRFLEAPRIAYLSMEVGIKNEIPTYSGGLGVLAGDTIRSSADLRVPLVAVTLASRKGYLKQKLTEDGQQLEYPDEWDPSRFMDLASAESNVRIEGRNVKINAWLYDYQSLNGGVVPIIFLDTDVEGNSAEDRKITDCLYGGDDRYRLKQEIVLGIGGVRMLKALGFNIRSYHMNEGHSSLLTLELLEENNMNVDKVRTLCIFTTHTPVEAAFDRFSYDLVQEMLRDEFPSFMDVLPKYGGQDKLNMTLLALNLSRYENGVTKAHMEYSRKLFPGYHIQAITNGVHSYTWTCPHFREIFDKHISGWANEPELLVRINEVPEEEIWGAHLEAKKELIDFVKEKTGVEMDLSKLTIGFARRATAYKRANLIFSDLTRLKAANKKGGLQIAFAGKAHPRDESGKQIIREIFRYKALLNNDAKIAYLENYDMNMAAKLTSGVDVWLNTPLPPYEASGTSGMKAAHNGVINFSVLDGWWIEGCVEDVTGWAIGPSPDEMVNEEERRTRELEDFYFKLDYIVIPTFYERRDKWIQIMKNSIGKVAYYFNSHRMMRRYITEAYLY